MRRNNIHFIKKRWMLLFLTGVLCLGTSVLTFAETKTLLQQEDFEKILIDDEASTEQDNYFKKAEPLQTEEVLEGAEGQDQNGQDDLELSDEVETMMMLHSNGQIEVVTNIAELQSKIDAASSGDTIWLGEELNTQILDDVLLIHEKDLVFRAISGPVTLYSAPDKRHMRVTGADVKLEFDNVILDGNVTEDIPIVYNQTIPSGGIDTECSHLTVINALIQHCYSKGDGGAIGSNSGYSNIALTIKGKKTLITKNRAYGHGGGIAFSKSTVTIEDGEISENQANHGGGISVGGQNTGGALYITGGKIINNETVYFGGSDQLVGGGVYIGNDAKLFLSGDNTLISGNRAATGGGIFGFRYSVITILGGTISDNHTFKFTDYDSLGGGIRTAGKISVENAIITDNTARQGGGIFARSSEPGDDISIKNVQIENNLASQYGGGLCAGGPLEISGDTIIRYNEAKEGGGGIFLGDKTKPAILSNNTLLDGNKSWADGGGIITLGPVSINGKVEIKNNAAAGDGGGIYTYDLDTLNTDSDVTFANNSASKGYEWEIDSTASAGDGTISGTHMQKILSTVFTTPFTNGYNNFDINYTGQGNVLYPVYYEANGGSGPAPSESPKAAGAAFQAAANTFTPPTNKQFAVWNEERNGSGVNYAEGAPITMPDNVLTLYAIWEDVPIVQTYSLTVKAGTGGTADNTVNGNYAAGSKISISAAPNTNYRFNKWESDNGGSFGQPSSANTTFIMPSKDVVLTASFEKINTGGGGGTSTHYAVTYKSNHGIETDYRVTGLTSGSRHLILGLADTKISRTNHDFIGWNTKANGTGTAYQPGDEIIIRGNVTLYAQWKFDDHRETDVGVLETEDHLVYLYGYKDGSVKADRSITRAEASAIFFRLLTDAGKHDAVPSNFKDINGDEWYAQEVNYLASIGIVTGYQDGTFRPDAPVTRAEFVKIAAMFDQLIPSGNVNFTDIESSHWAYSYICTAIQHGWIDGYQDGTFQPENPITRSEVVRIVNAQLNRKIDAAALAQSVNPYNDIDQQHWAYADIIEASIYHDYQRSDEGVERWILKGTVEGVN